MINERTRGPAAERTPISVGQALQWAIGLLAPATSTPSLEAQVLLAHVLATSRASILAHPERPLSPDQRTRYYMLVQHRASEYPLPYLLGCIEFYGLAFEITPEVLIPRPETETLVDLALARRPATIIDMGVGSGCIAVALAVHMPKAVIHGVDISPAALVIARQNAERHRVADRVHLTAGDVLNPAPPQAELIVSNPPYIPTAELPRLPRSVQHEPRLALDGGPDGLTVIRRLLSQAAASLAPGGALLIEIGADQGEAACRLARAHFPHAAIRLHQDLSGRDRVLEVQT